MFDLDGVLIDSNRIKRAAFFEAIASLGAPAELIGEIIDASPEGDRFSIIGEILRRHDRDRATPELVATYAARYGRVADEQAASCPEMPSATATLSALSARYPLFLNSATPLESLDAIVSRRGWTPYFRAIFGRPATKLENLGRILQQTRLPAQSVLFVGDQPSDAAAAERCGCRFVGIENGQGSLVDTNATVLKDLPSLVALLRDEERHA